MTQCIMNPVSVYFKEAWTEKNKKYMVYPNWTLNQFRNVITPLISIDFNIEVGAFELVLVGQDKGENGAPIGLSDQIQLYQLWGETLEIYFYIRRI